VVDAGQFLERMTTLTLDDGSVLEALFHRGDRAPAVVIAPGVPGAGGIMEGPVVTELTWAIARVGHSTIRFNFRGVGASTGALEVLDLVDGEAVSARSLATMARDLEAAVTRQRENFEGEPIAVVAYAFGAEVALALDAPIERLVLVAPRAESICVWSAAIALRRETVTVVLPRGLLDDAATEALAASGVDVRVVEGSDARLTRGLPALGRAVASLLTDDRPAWIER